MIADYFPVKRNDNWELRYEHRSNALKKGMFAFVSWEWVIPFAEWIGERKCLEVMAGRGWLSYALRQRDIDVIATDDYSWHKEQKWEEPVTTVEEINCVDSITVYGRDIDILIMSWPYMDSNAYDTIKALHEVNPEALIVYIGEGYGGCTADDMFFEHISFIEDDELFNKASGRFKSFDGIHDRLRLGKYK